MDRRQLFKMAAVGVSGTVLAKTSGASECGNIVPTVQQTEGPFYPKDWKDYEADADMTQIEGSVEHAQGQVVLLTGTVQDLNCKPLSGAQVDVWQANIFGQYFHESDATFNELKDKGFQYRCRVITNEKGEFSVKTIKPAPYPAGGNWVRPPHIHFKVMAEGLEELTTQMYFGGDPLNPRDRILLNMTPAQRDGVIVDFTENEHKILTGHFDITMN